MPKNKCFAAFSNGSYSTEPIHKRFIAGGHSNPAPHSFFKSGRPPPQEACGRRPAWVLASAALYGSSIAALSSGNVSGKFLRTATGEIGR